MSARKKINHQFYDAASAGPANPLDVYFQQISQYSLLTKEEEFDLGTIIQAGVKRVKKEFPAKAEEQSGHWQGGLTAEQRKLLREIDPEVKAALDKLSAHNLRLVVFIAKKLQNPGLPLLDLIQEGNKGLLEAVEKFNPDQGTKFSTYAVWRVKRDIKFALREADNRRFARISTHAVGIFKKIDGIRNGFRAEHGYYPTVEELMDEYGVTKKAYDVYVAVKGSKAIQLSAFTDDDSVFFPFEDIVIPINNCT